MKLKQIFNLTFVLAILFTANTNVSAQSFADRSFHTIGYSIYLDFARAPLANEFTSVYNSNTDENEIVKVPREVNTISIFTFMYRFRYNLAEVSDEFAIGASASPAIGLDVNTGGGDGFARFNIPFMVSAEFGAGSTYNSGANVGGFVGVGMEYNVFPLFGANSEAVEGEEGSYEYDKSWVQPVLGAGIRYWSRANRLREIAFKYGFSGSEELVDVDGDVINSNYKPFTFRITFNYILNY